MNSKKTGSIITFVILFLIIFWVMMGNNVSGIIYIKNYIVNLISFSIMIIIFFGVWSKSGYDIFEPFFLVSVIYIILFTVTPMLDLSTHEIEWFGIDLFQYGIQGTLIALIGYLAFVLFYATKIVLGGKEYFRKTCTYQYEYNCEKVSFYALIAWLFCFSCSMIYFAADGKGITYVLSLGFLTGATEVNIGGSASVGFLSLLTYSLIPLYFIYMHFAKRKVIGYAMFYTTLMIQLLRGFRFIVVIMILAMLMISYLNKRTRPSMKTIFLIGLILMTVIGIMGFYRGASRGGTMNSLNWNEFNINTILDSVIGNFRIYKTYYAVIKTVPSMVSYMYGKQIFIYTIIMFIPRMVWPGKPGNPGMDAIKIGLSDYAAAAGQAYPNIGEFYYEFGIIGVIIFMSFFGWLLRKIKYRYLYSNDPLDIIIISIWVPSTLQLVIRGYTPSNFYLLVFMLMPIWLLRKLCSTKIVDFEEN